MSIDVSELERLLKVLQRYGVRDFDCEAFALTLAPLGGYDALEPDSDQEEPTSALEAALRKGRS